MKVSRKLYTFLMRVWMLINQQTYGARKQQRYNLYQPTYKEMIGSIF